MALVPAGPAGSFVELEACKTADDLARLLDSQRELFHGQIDQLQGLVVTQCNLTGVNPLSQEMAVGALSIKIGKRPRDFLNPKAIKYMQSIFSIKDTLGKRETREISARCGVTVTQVREYFSGQRSKVRKLVRLSREAACRAEASTDGGTLSSNQVLPLSQETPMNTMDLMITGEYMQIPCSSGTLSGAEDAQVPGNKVVQVIGNRVVQQGPANSENLNTAQAVQQGPKNSVNINIIKEDPSCSLKDEYFPGIDSDDKKFLETILNLMGKEKTFSGQMKLMEWILQIHNLAVLHGFLSKGGLSILASWLSQAASEEQTTALLVIMKVLYHLPLFRAFPVQMSDILQTVNRLRFYRTSDISNKAKGLLSRWSKLLIKRQVLNKPSLTNPKDAQKEMNRQKRIGEFLREVSWQPMVDIPEEILALDTSLENNRKPEPRVGQKLLMSSSDDSIKRNGLGVSSSKNKERRAVLLVEQPDRKSTGKTLQVRNCVPSNHSRPLSADDIQKAKLRASIMQDKHGKTSSATCETRIQKIEEHKLPPASEATNSLSTSVTSQKPHLRKNESKKSWVLKAEPFPEKLETSTNYRPNSTTKENLWDSVKRSQLHWQTPPEIRIDPLWKVGAGENSKEVEVQTERNRRDKGVVYANAQEIPPNPKQPWDMEMDFDDSLTPEVPIEQPPEADAAPIIPPEQPREADSTPVMPIEQPTEAVVTEASSCFLQDRGNATAQDMSVATSAAPVGTIANGAALPDVELLAVLLQNPDLVFALTSGQGRNMSNDQTVALLDAIKKSGLGVAALSNGLLDGFKETTKELEPTSLPSPTPPAGTMRSNWRSDFSTPAAAAASQPQFRGIGGATIPPVVSQPQPPVNVAINHQSPISRLPPQMSTSVSLNHQLAGTNNLSSQQAPALSFQSKGPADPVIKQFSSPVYPFQQSQSSMDYPITGARTVASSVFRQEPINHNPSNMPSQPSLLPSSSRAQSSFAAHPMVQPKAAGWPPAASNVGRHDLTKIPYIAEANSTLEAPVYNAHLPSNRSNYNMFPNGTQQQSFHHPGQSAVRTSYINAPDLETWNLEDSSYRSPGFGPGRAFTEQQPEFGQGYTSEWSRQRSTTAHSDRHRGDVGSKRFRDWGRDRDGDRDRDRDRQRRR